MKFHRTTIRDFDGFKVSGIKSLEHKWESPNQVIIGANGYGKSRYMKTCTPLPLTKTQFGPAGYHERSIEHNGHMFRIVSDYANKGMVHTFQIDGGPNLNEGGTSTVQSELVQKYLGYTPTVNSLVLNTLNVATMKPAERRQFFMELLPSTDHFLSHHRAIVSKIKALTSTISTLTERKSHLESRILSPEDHSSLQQSVKDQMTASAAYLAAMSKVEVLLSQMEVPANNNEGIASLDYVRDKVGAYNTNVTMAMWVNLLSPTADIDLRNDINMLKSELSGIQKDIDDAIADISAKESMVSTLIVDVSEAELSMLKSKLAEIDSAEPTPSFWTQELLSKAKDNASILTESLFPIADGTIRAISDKDIRATESRHRVVSQMIHDLEIALNEDINALKAAKGKLSDTLSVPGECQIETCILRQKITELKETRYNTMQTLEVAISKKTASLADHKKELDTLASVLSASKPFSYAVSNILQIVNSLLNLSRDDIIDMLISNPMQVYRLYYAAYVEGVNALEAAHLRRRIADIEAKLSVCVTAGIDVQTVNKQIAEGERTVAELRDRYAEVSNRVAYKNNVLLPIVVKLSQDRDALSRIERTLKLYYDGLIIEHDRAILQSIYDFISTEYKTCLINLARDETTLREQDGLRARLDDEILVTLSQCEADLSLCKKIEAELSPTTGMPFAHMRQFLNRIFTIANSLMSVVFVYPLKINLIEPDDQLSYKFTITANGTEIDDDMSACSTAQVAVMDTCLTLAIRKVMQLCDYPFFLDEVGSSFDPQHKHRLINLLEHIVHGRYASQLFVINHDVIIHGGLSHSDVVALSTINVILPSVYNEHVMIT